MRLAALVLALPGCAFFGSLTQASTTALGAAAGAAIGGPAGAAVGGVAGFYGGDLAAEELTGTRAVRIATEAGGSGQQIGDALGDAALGAAGIPNSKAMIWILLVVISFFSLGGPAWVARGMAKRKAEDDAWARALESERMAHKSRTAALESEVKGLRKEIDSLRARKAARKR